MKHVMGTLCGELVLQPFALRMAVAADFHQIRKFTKSQQILKSIACFASLAGGHYKIGMNL